MVENKGLALVTGASSGMGRETARRLAEAGFRVIAAARREDRLRELAREVRGVQPRPVDLSDPGQVEGFFAEISSLSDPVTVLVNNAGYSIRGALEAMTSESIRRVFQVNLFSAIRITQACLPSMRRRRQGIIVNVSSMVGKFAFPMAGVYAATKHALEAVTDALRMEMRPFGVKVVTIRPGFVATEFNETANVLSAEMLAGTDPDYTPLLQTSGPAVGRLFVGATVPGPEVIAETILEAVLSESPRAAYTGGFMSSELLGKRAGLSDEDFDRYFSELTGLWGLKL